MIRPRITPHRTPAGMGWSCSSDGLQSGWGTTPEQAYAAWRVLVLLAAHPNGLVPRRQR